MDLKHPQTERVLVGCALKREVEALRRHLGETPPSISFLATGLGARRTGRTLNDHFRDFRPAVFLFTGTAGQLDPSLPMGEVVCPKEWLLNGGGQVTPGNQRLLEEAAAAGLAIRPLGLTVAVPVIRARRRQELFQRTGAVICDMEAAAALAVARDFEIAGLALKVVSDTADQGISAFWSGFDENLGRLADALRPLLARFIAQRTRPGDPGIR